MRVKPTGLLFALTLALAVLMPTLSSASSPVATTGNATSITTTSAKLNGIIDPTYSDNTWTFEYSTTSDYSSNVHITPPVAAGAGTQAVSANVSGLTPATKYYFRVAVGRQADTTQPPHYDLGDTNSFTTLSNSTGGGNPPPVVKLGKASVASKSVTVSHKTAAVPMHCTGAAGALCIGKVYLAITGSGGRVIACGSGKFGTKAPKTVNVRIPVNAKCRQLLAHAKHHRLAARVAALFLTRQASFTKRVTLVG